MFVFGQGCHVCKRSTSDPAYRKDPRTGERLYWMDPKFNEPLGQPVHFCGPKCVQDYLKAQAARSGEESLKAGTP
jgi:hypothetical protein